MPATDLVNYLKNSVAKINVTGREDDYENPELGAMKTSWHGSGAVILFKGEKLILSNYHVANGATRLTVMLGEDDDRFEGEVIASDKNCDLALVRITDINKDVFQKKAKPVTIGKLATSRQKLTAIGFPMGGDAMCVTDGIVSRSEVGAYCLSDGIELLRTQTQTPVNPGNSGGGIYDDEGNLVGITHESYSASGSGVDNIGYFIPIPVIIHFLKDALLNKEYQGFPELGLSYQYLNNDSLRRDFKLEDSQTGLLITKIYPLSDLHGIIKSGDILTHIDGHSISNNGTTKIKGIGDKIDCSFLWTTAKYIGDNINFKILRDGKELNFDIMLTKSCCQMYKVGPTIVGERPNFYWIPPGIQVVEVTRNLLETSIGEELKEVIDPIWGDISFAPAKSPDDKIVMINKILNNEYNRDDFLFCLKAIVKEVNGVKIKNLKEVMDLVDSNTGKYNTLTISGGIHPDLNTPIYFVNIPKDEHVKMLKSFTGSTKDRSKELENGTSVILKKIEKLKISDDKILGAKGFSSEPSKPATLTFSKSDKKRKRGQNQPYDLNKKVTFDEPAHKKSRSASYQGV